MNFLSHHAVALRAAKEDARSPWFFVGNVVPDLLATSGDGRLRVAPTGTTGDLADGVRLHLATDRRFHGHPAFREAMAEVSMLLREAPFTTTPRRVFFLAHVFVEVALDGNMLVQHPGIADDLYARIEECGPAETASATAILLDLPTPRLTATLRDFLTVRYLYSYATWEGQAAALDRICRRAGLTGFPSGPDRDALADTLAGFAPRLVIWKERLLTPPDGFSMA